MPKICCDRWTKYSGGIHCRAGKRAPEQNIECDGRPNGKTGQTASARVHGGAVDHEDEKEGQNSFHQNSLPSGQINGKLRSSSNDHIAPEQTEANQRSRDSAEQLRHPVPERL